MPRSSERVAWMGLREADMEYAEVGLQKSPREQGVTPNERQSSSVKRGWQMNKARLGWSTRNKQRRKK